ncbi:peptidylprolyl isomerase [bacterium]|nr:peptidylprolyl isomerase [bacterium]
MKILQTQIGLVIFFSLTSLLMSQENRQFVRVAQENIRKSPNGQKIGELGSGAQVQILETRENWVKIQMTAWIWKNSLTGDSTLVEGYKIRVSHILVDTPEKAQEAILRIKRGESFSTVADQLSLDRTSALKGGDLGSFGRGDLLPEFEDAAFALLKGGLSGTVKTKLGYHVILRTE